MKCVVCGRETGVFDDGFSKCYCGGECMNQDKGFVVRNWPDPGFKDVLRHKRRVRLSMRKIENARQGIVRMVGGRA